MRSATLIRALRSTRVRAGLGLGVVAALGTTGTFAFWTDSVTISGSSFTSGTLDLQVDGSNGYLNTSGGYPATGTSSASLSMSNMTPGASSAQILTVKNNGNVPLKWTLSGQLNGGSQDADFSTANALTVTVKTGAAISGSGNAATCSGGTVLGTTVALKTTTSAIVSTSQPNTAGSGLAPTGTVPLCFQVNFDLNAPTTLQSKSTKADFTFAGTSDLS